MIARFEVIASGRKGFFVWQSGPDQNPPFRTWSGPPRSRALEVSLPLPTELDTNAAKQRRDVLS